MRPTMVERTVKPNGPKIAELRKVSGFSSREKLVERIKELREQGKKIKLMSVGTLKSMEESKECFADNLMSVAVALGFDSIEPLLIHAKSQRIVGAEALRQATVGGWTGSVQQEKGPNNRPLSFTFELQFDLDGDRLKGAFDISRKHEGSTICWRFLLEGDYYVPRFLQLDCRPQDPAVLQFSAWVLELSNDAKRLDGRYVGFGALTREIVSGKLTLRKKPAGKDVSLRS